MQGYVGNYTLSVYSTLQHYHFTLQQFVLHDMCDKGKVSSLTVVSAEDNKYDIRIQK